MPYIFQPDYYIQASKNPFLIFVSATKKKIGKNPQTHKDFGKIKQTAFRQKSQSSKEALSGAGPAFK